MAMETSLRLRLRLRLPLSRTSSPIQLPPIPRGLHLRSPNANGRILLNRKQPGGARCCSATVGSGSSWWENWKSSPIAVPETRASDVVWPSAGAFLAMAILGKMDQIIAPTGLSFTIAPLGAVCTVLFATPAAPGARKYNMFMAQLGCAAFGVFSLYLFGPGWLARSTALAASIAFMIITRSIHPPAAGLPIMFIDGAKFHNLHFWYILFPGAAGCLILCLIQELVDYMRENYKF